MASAGSSASGGGCGRLSSSSTSSTSYRSTGGGVRKSRSRERDNQAISIRNVADVYDIAADIGREFETLIDSHGAEHVTSLMQKVISALEHLEQLSSERDKEKTTIDHLQGLVKHLELEDSKKLEERQRNAKELEQVEEHYKQETRDLLSTVKRLQDENRKLASSLAAATERDSAFSEDESYFEVDLVNKLETVIEKQRSQIKKLDQSVLDYKTENDELTCQNEKLTACTRDLRRKLRSTQSQLHLLVDERADLTAKVQDQQREVHNLTKQLGRVAKEFEDLSAAGAAAASSSSSTPAAAVDQPSDSAAAADGAASTPPAPPAVESDDPNRPRFSLPELRDILQERNSLKARVSDLEDELTVYKPNIKDKLSGVASPSRSPRVRLADAVANCDCAFHAKKATGGDGGLHDANLADYDQDDLDDAIECDEVPSLEDQSTAADDVNDEDLPVQGPLPQDPDDAPFLKNESGIRKLFRRVFGASNDNYEMSGEGGCPYQTRSGGLIATRDGSKSRSSSSGQEGLIKSISRFSFLVSPRESVSASSAAAGTAPNQ